MAPLKLPRGPVAALRGVPKSSLLGCYAESPRASFWGATRGPQKLAFGVLRGVHKSLLLGCYACAQWRLALGPLVTVFRYPLVLSSFSRRLIRWYRAQGRALPWRRTSDPYAIWLSEIMLQQTQVATVIPYYNRFLSRFPSVQSLASASLHQVLKHWEGLGYYARCRHMHLAAKEMVHRFRGRIPRRMEDLCSLPGIGRSTAGAILSIAFNAPHPILDGNVRRILCRYFAIEKPPKTVEAALWNHSKELLPKKDVGVYTQAIMDFGATLCSKKPLCHICPVQSGCLGYQRGVQTHLPISPVRKTIPHYDYVAGVARAGSLVAIRCRPEKGLLGGLWEFPCERVDDQQRADLIRVISVSVKAHTGYRPYQITPMMVIDHAFTHFRMTLHVFACKIRARGVPHSTSNVEWVEATRLSWYPFSSAHKKIARVLTRPLVQTRPKAPL